MGYKIKTGYFSRYFGVNHDISGKLLLRPGDAQFFHSGFKGGRFQPQQVGRALLSADTPGGLVQHIDDMVSLNRFKLKVFG